MTCMKCGREIEFGQVFCETCLADMEQYPVKPDIVVQLPPRTEKQSVKKQPQRRRPSLPPEEQIKHLKKRTHWLIAALIVVLLLTGVMAFFNGTLIKKLEGQIPLGRNYSTVVNSQPSGSTQPDPAE